MKTNRRSAGAGLVILTLAWAMVSAQDPPQPDEESNVNYGSLAWSPQGDRLLFTAIRVKNDYSDYDEHRWGLFVYEFASKKISRLDSGCIYAAFSPDGKKVAYDKRETDKGEILVRDLESGQTRNLSQNPAKDFAPAWSPDGSRIAFNSDRDGMVEIYLMNADGSGVHRLTHSGGFKSYNPEWSANGIVYFFEKGDNKDQVYFIDPEEKAPANVTRNDQHNFFAGWAPGGRIVYTRGDDSICTIQPDGSGGACLEGFQGSYGRFSPSGEELAYLGSSGVFLTRVENGRAGESRLLADADSLAEFFN